MGDIEYDERIICRCCGGTTAGKSNLCRECADEEHDRSHEDGTDANRRAEERQERADGTAVRLPDSRMAAASERDEDGNIIADEDTDEDEEAQSGDRKTLSQAVELESQLNEDAGTDPGNIPGETAPDSEGGDPTVAEQIDEDEDAE